MNLMKTASPYSKNIVFFDTEFTSLDAVQGEILSLGMIKMNADELYLKLEYEGDVDEWPKENILPTLRGEKCSRAEAVRAIGGHR